MVITMNELNPSDYPKKDISLRTLRPWYESLPDVVLAILIVYEAIFILWLYWGGML